jgi:hypothetical protein
MSRIVIIMQCGVSPEDSTLHNHRRHCLKPHTHQSVGIAIQVLFCIRNFTHSTALVIRVLSLSAVMAEGEGREGFANRSLATRG